MTPPTTRSHNTEGTTPANPMEQQNQLLQQLVSLMSQATRSTPPGETQTGEASKTTTVTKPPAMRIAHYKNFRTSGAPELWLRRKYEKLGKHLGWRDQDLRDSFPTYLEGTAESWYEMKQMEKAPELSEWNTLRAAFVEEFTPGNLKMLYFDLIIKARQEPRQSVQDFAYELDTLCRLYKQNMGEDEKIMYFVKGLKPNISEIMYNFITPSMTYSQAVKVALQRELGESLRRGEKTSFSINSVGEESIQGGNNKGKQEHPQRSCSYCGGKRHPSLLSCPARGKVCNQCRKLNHFASVCRSKPRRNGQEKPRRNSSPDDMKKIFEAVNMLKEQVATIHKAQVEQKKD